MNRYRRHLNIVESPPYDAATQQHRLSQHQNGLRRGSKVLRGLQWADATSRSPAIHSAISSDDFVQNLSFRHTSIYLSSRLIHPSPFFHPVYLPQVA
jgi:hypothetical protein